ncbi:hypothetical protein CMV_026817 [Castanea mollissima]|uniref:Uncharacterized protein n=1 Tax=Castanea mollissima TaxID=60419 RepID=A0A8J4QB34_9ROSI|nr:hypothetical protein CMV_026817 [Castanea mollissima]
MVMGGSVVVGGSAVDGRIGGGDGKSVDSAAVVGGVMNMDSFFKLFFHKLNYKKMKTREDNFCVYYDNIIEAYLSLLFGSAVVAALASVFLYKKQGRKWPLLLGFSLLLLGSSLSSSTKVLWILFIGRIITGIGIGFMSQSSNAFGTSAVDALSNHTVDSVAATRPSPKGFVLNQKEESFSPSSLSGGTVAEEASWSRVVRDDYVLEAVEAVVRDDYVLEAVVRDDYVPEAVDAIVRDDYVEAKFQDDYMLEVVEAVVRDDHVLDEVLEPMEAVVRDD